MLDIVRYQFDKELWQRGKRDAYDFTDFPDLQERYLRLKEKSIEIEKLGYYQYSQQEIKDKLDKIKELSERNNIQ